jgi:2-polyprenyl-6-methoxyphenol hydroxylase-like FAD-dependent oxidoreductase
MSSLACRRALVVGAGLGGLTAAAALARHFAHVTVVERDRLPVQPEPRAGVPQGRHVHGLLAGGGDALETLLPGFTVALATAGAVPIRMGLDVRLEQPGYDPFPQRDLGRTGYSMSRPLLEHVVRTRLERDERIEIRTHCRVREIVAAADGRSEGAVRIDVHGAAAQNLPADLIVDASGRGALTLEFLAASGCEVPEESSIPVDIRYTCAVFTLTDDDTRDWKMLQTRPEPGVNNRRAIMFPIEGGRSILGLGGVDGESAPPDRDGYLDFARTLRTSTAYEAIRNAEMHGEIVRFAFPKSTRRHFERLAAFPRGLLPVADAICRINPSYGQGMSVAAREALLLDQVLASLSERDDPLADLAPAFFAKLGDVLDTPWAVAGQDYAYPHLQSLRPPDFAARARYQSALTSLAASDASVHKIMLEVSNLLKPASVLREPELSARIHSRMRADSD